MSARKLFYLGPQGTFTHQAAVNAAQELARLEPQGFDLMPMDDVPQILDAAQHGDGWGIVAWENNVEGYVVPNLDALIDAKDLVGFARVGVNVEFDAYVAQGADPAEARIATAHPHGLAQCKRFIAEHHLKPEPSSSNAAACRDLQPGQVALGPSICGELYNLDTLAEHVQDFEGARTEFLVIAPRDVVQDLNARAHRNNADDFETIITFIPLVTGPGVLADLLDVLRDAGLNMTSFISRPIKGNDGTYSFIATLDAAPREPKFHAVLEEIAEHGDWAKTLAVYPRRERPSPPVDAWMLPEGGVHVDAEHPSEGWQHTEEARRELLW